MPELGALGTQESLGGGKTVLKKTKTKKTMIPLILQS